MTTSPKPSASKKFSTGWRAALSRKYVQRALILAPLSLATCGRAPFEQATGKAPDGTIIPVDNTCYSRGAVAPDVWAACQFNYAKDGKDNKPVSMSLGPSVVATPSEGGTAASLAVSGVSAAGTFLEGLGFVRGSGSGRGTANGVLGAGTIGTLIEENVTTKVGTATRGSTVIVAPIVQPAGM